MNSNIQNCHTNLRRSTSGMLREHVSVSKIWSGVKKLLKPPVNRRRRSQACFRPTVTGLESLEVRCLLSSVTPLISISDTTIIEGDSGTKYFPVNVTLSQTSSVPVTVNYSTANVSALAGFDYVSTSGTLTIPPGQLSAQIAVTCIGDVIDEPDETFAIVLDPPSNATISRRVGTITISDNDPPAISIDDTAVVEGNGSLMAVLNVALSSRSPLPVSVRYTTLDRMAQTGKDYQSRSGTLTIPAGKVSGQIKIPIINDILDEADETFIVKLSSPVNGTLAKESGTITIVDDDVPPVISILNSTVTEGSAGISNASIAVTLSIPSGLPVSLAFQTVGVTASSGVDYQDVAGTVVIPAGQTKGMITVPIIGDTIDGPNESLRITLSNAVNALLGNATALLTINDDDGTQLPLFQMSDLAYLGAFAVPTGTFGSATFEYGGNAIAFNPENNSLFMGSNYDDGLNIAEVKIPSTLSPSGALKTLPQASVLQQFSDLGGLLTVNASGNLSSPTIGYENLSLGGLLVANGGLTGGMFMGYNGVEPQESTNSHFRTNGLHLAALNSSTVTGLLDIRTDSRMASGRVRGGYMTAVPEQWRSWIGADFVTGAAGQNRIQFSSSGPALFGFDATNPQGSSGSPLVNYPYGNALQWGKDGDRTPQLLFNGTTKIDGVAFVPGTRSVVFFGSNGLSTIGYGVGSKFNDKVRPYSGFHTQNGNYKYQLWAYDIDDFMAVRNGTRNSWEIRTTKVSNFDLPTPEGSKYLGGTAFDAATGRLYVSQKFAGLNATPVIHVYQLGRTPVPRNTTATGFKSVSLSKSASTTALVANDLKTRQTVTHVTVLTSSKFQPTNVARTFAQRITQRTVAIRNQNSTSTPAESNSAFNLIGIQISSVLPSSELQNVMTCDGEYGV